MKLNSKLIIVSMLATVGNVNSALAAPDSSVVAVEANRSANLFAVADTAKSPLADTVAPQLDQQAMLAKRKKKPVKAPAKKPPVNAAPAPAPDSAVPTPAPDSTTPEPTTSDESKRVLVTDLAIQSTNAPIPADLQKLITEEISSKVGQPTTTSQIQQDVNKIYTLGYFKDVRVIPENTAQGVKLVYSVTFIDIGLVKKVTLKPASSEAPSLLPQNDTDSIFQELYGKNVNLGNLLQYTKKMEDKYHSQGYSLAQFVKIDKFDSEGNLSLIVKEGLIEDLQIAFLNKEQKEVDEQGNPIRGNTRSFIITREISTKPGQVFNEKTIGQDLRRVFGLGLFEDVRLSLAISPRDPYKSILRVGLIERKTGSISAGGGVSSASGIFGSVSYQEQNLGGNAQRLGGEVQLGTRELLFDVNLSDPWIAGDPNRTSYNVNLFQRRSISLVFDGGPNRQFASGTGDIPRVVRSGGGITFARPLDGNPFSQSAWRASAGVQYQKVSVQDASGAGATVDTAGKPLTFSGTGQDDLLMVQLGLSQDLRNSFIDPTQGSLLRLGLDQSVPVGSGNILMTRVTGSYTQYVPVSLLNLDKGSQALVFSLKGGTVFGDLPPYEAFSLGGSSSVRGFDDGAVGSGKSFVQASAEYRFPIISIVGGTLFADYGTDLGTGSRVPGDPAATRGKPGNGFGYGAGVRINSPLGPLRLDFGLNNQGDSRIQFGIGERF
jgi:outer membrane protein insertion porin family